MTGATLGVAFFFVVIAMTRRSGGSAVGILVMSMLLWPEYLRLPLGVAEMSVPRIVGIFILLKYSMGSDRKSKAGLCKVDAYVILLWLWIIFSAVIADSDFKHITQTIGRGFDTVLMYFVARLAMLSLEDAKGLNPALSITAAIMGALGVYEAITYFSPYSSMTDYRTWHWIDKDQSFRYGFLRAKASTSVHIYFGMAMMLVAGILWASRKFLKRPAVYKIALLAAALGVLSSMSSGPWIALFFLIIFNLYEKRPRLIKPSLYAIIFIAVFAEIFSKRHFYHLIDYIALDPQTAWYRTKLIEVAFSRWHEFSMVGVGGAWPHHWGALVDGRQHIDVVNHYLIIALYGGIPAVILYVASHVIAIKNVVKAWQTDVAPERRSLLFGLAATVIALDFSSMSVGLFGPPLLLSYILLGSLVSASLNWQDYEKPATGDRRNSNIAIQNS